MCSIFKIRQCQREPASDSEVVLFMLCKSKWEVHLDNGASWKSRSSQRHVVPAPNSPLLFVDTIHSEPKGRILCVSARNVKLGFWHAVLLRMWNSCVTFSVAPEGVAWNLTRASFKKYITIEGKTWFKWCLCRVSCTFKKKKKNNNRMSFEGWYLLEIRQQKRVLSLIESLLWWFHLFYDFLTLDLMDKHECLSP